MKKQKEDTKLIVTGGGSGGHLNTAISVIKYIQQEDKVLADSILYVGGKRGMIGDSAGSIESRRIPELGIRFIGINSGKLHRKFNFTTIKLLFGAFIGFFDSLIILIKHRPKLIFSSGGYVTLPVVIVGWLLRIPSVIHEQTIAAGLANKIASKFATKVLITFPDSEKYFPNKKTVVVGAPLQNSRFITKLPDDSENILTPEYLNFLKNFRKNSESKSNILITGGGLGSHKLNKWFLENIAELNKHFRILIITGENKLFSDYENISQKISINSLGNVFAVKWYRDEIGYILANTDLVIARPGANTVLELLATNNKALLLPIKWSSANEQVLNASYFVENQIGKIIDEDKLDQELSISLIMKYSEIKPRISSTKVSLDATSKIYKVLKEYF